MNISNMFFPFTIKCEKTVFTLASYRISKKSKQTHLFF